MKRFVSALLLIATLLSAVPVHGQDAQPQDPWRSSNLFFAPQMSKWLGMAEGEESDSAAFCDQDKGVGARHNTTWVPVSCGKVTEIEQYNSASLMFCLTGCPFVPGTLSTVNTASPDQNYYAQIQQPRLPEVTPDEVEKTVRFVSEYRRVREFFIYASTALWYWLFPSTKAPRYIAELGLDKTIVVVEAVMVDEHATYWLVLGYTDITVAARMGGYKFLRLYDVLNANPETEPSLAALAADIKATQSVALEGHELGSYGLTPQVIDGSISTGLFGGASLMAYYLSKLAQGSNPATIIAQILFFRDDSMTCYTDGGTGKQVCFVGPDPGAGPQAR